MASTDPPSTPPTPPSFLQENKKLIITTATCAVVTLLVIKFFDFIFWGGLLVALVVATVLAWNYLTQKHGGAKGVWQAFLAELGFKEPGSSLATSIEAPSEPLASTARREGEKRPVMPAPMLSITRI